MITPKQKDKLCKLLREAQPGLLFPWSYIAKFIGIEHDPDAVKKAVNSVRRVLKKEGHTYLSSRGATWKSSDT